MEQTKNIFAARKRYWIMALGILIFLPPLSFIFQITQDSNFCGTWCPRMFFVWRQGITLERYMDGILRSYMGAALVFGILATTFAFGRYWCSHICPVGGALELGSRLVPKPLKIDYSSVPGAPVRYGYLSVYLLAPLFGIGSLCCRYCNFATVPRLFGAAFSPADMSYFLRTAGLVNLALIVLLGFLSRGGRAYCNLICPIGALDALFNRIGLKMGKRMRIDESRCNACGKCASACPTWAIDVDDRARLDPLSCMPCRICEERCPKEAIRYE